MDKKPVNVASEYLQKLLNHTKDILERRFGSRSIDMKK